MFYPFARETEITVRNYTITIYSRKNVVVQLFLS